MYQSSTRKNFLDTLLDPTAIAILASIALHATIGATLPFLTPPDKVGTKAGPTTVKVVELTPSELQRIPQAPSTPAPQVLPPVTQPTTPRPQATPPSTPEFSTAPQTIPFPSIVGTPQPKKVTSKPKSATKQQKGIRQKKPTVTVFDPAQILKPQPKPTKSPLPKGVTVKPSPQPQPKPKTRPKTKKTQTPTARAPQQQNSATDDDGGSQQQPSTPVTKPTRQAQQPTETPQPSGTPNQPTTQPATQPSGDPIGNSNGNNFYGKYVDAAIKQLRQYMNEYGVTNPYPTNTITRSYPQGTVCGKEKQAPFIVLMAVFDKVPDNADAAILGTSSAPSLKISTFKDRDTPEQQKLGEIATRSALEEASKADQNRPEKDKGKRVIYQYRVQFDPATCKN